MTMFSNKNLILSWLEDEESKYIYQKRIEYYETNDFKPIIDIREKYILETNYLKKFYEKIDNTEIWIWGAGRRFHLILDHMHFAPNAKLCGIIDTSTTKANTIINSGIKIYEPKNVDFTQIKCLVISVADSESTQHIINEAQSLGINPNNIVLFSDYYIRVPNKQYFSELIKYDKKEIFVDAGVYDLQTTFSFIEQCKLHNVLEMKSFAFEPDPLSFKKCCEAKLSSNHHNIELINSALYSKNTTLQFQMRIKGASRISTSDANANSTSVNAVALDSYTNEKITFIKMDVEGSELEALKGCQETIKKHKPKLAICIYHKPEDLIEIPMYIKSLVPEYKLYIRHYGLNQNETVLYALPY